MPAWIGVVCDGRISIVAFRVTGIWNNVCLVCIPQHVGTDKM